MIKMEYPDYEDMELKEAILKLIRQLLCKLGFHNINMFEKLRKKRYYQGRIRVARLEIYQFEMKRAILQRAIDELTTERQHKIELRDIEIANKKTDMDSVKELTSQIAQYEKDLEGYTDERGNRYPGLADQMNQFSETIIGLEQRIVVMKDIVDNKKIDGL